MYVFVAFVEKTDWGVQSEVRGSFEALGLILCGPPAQVVDVDGNIYL